MMQRLCFAWPCLLALNVYAASPATEVPKELDALKQLAGTWEGTSRKGQNPEQKASVVYEITSGGTAVTSKLFPGQPHEMISVYHKEGKSVGMTHFCAAGNAPQMVLKKADGKTMTFEIQKSEGLSSPSESHMHAVTLTMVDANTLQEEWSQFENGKKTDAVTFNFKRIGTAAPAPKAP